MRDILAHIIETNIKDNDEYKEIQESLKRLNKSKNKSFFSGIEKKINNNLKEWNIEANFKINEISESDLLKNLIQISFKDGNLNGDTFNLDRYGSGFQRSVIFELLKEASSFSGKKDNKSNDFTLLLFEEPEAFLHPTQQENLAYSLKKITKTGYQVFITTHSSTFVGKSSGSLEQIRRLAKNEDGISSVYYLSKDNLIRMDEMNSAWEEVLKNKVFTQGANSSNDIGDKDAYRYRIWIDSERASIFFADKVLLVEGETEKALFNYLLADKWNDLSKEHIFILNVLGKYNIPRYMNLLSEFRIPFGILIDGDQTKKKEEEREKHRTVNEYISEHRKDITCVLGEHYVFDGDLEEMLETEKPQRSRDDLKPIYILEWIINSSDKEKEKKLSSLREIFCKVLGINSKKR